jgi:hypothetical protein
VWVWVWIGVDVVASPQVENCPKFDEKVMGGDGVNGAIRFRRTNSHVRAIAADPRTKLSLVMILEPGEID